MPIQLSGSLVITGSITTTGVITMSGSIASASYSSTSDLLQGTGSVGFTTTASFNAVSASQQQISSSYIALSASYNTFSGSASTRITENSSSIQQVSSSQQQISSSQQQISSSLLNVISVFATTGSNSFRANQSITGSLVVSSTITAQTLVVQTVTSSIVYSSGSNIFGCDLNSRQTFTGSFYQTGSVASFSSCVGIGITTPTYYLDVQIPAVTQARFRGCSTDASIIRIENSSNSACFSVGVAGNNNVGSAPNNSLYLRDETNNIVKISMTSGSIGTILLNQCGGNVGIGTITPGDLLHIEKCQAGGMGMIIRNSCGATSNTSMCSLISLQLVGAGQTGQIGVNLIAGKEGDYSSAGVRNAFFAIQTACGDNLYERLRITSTGNLGIGTSSPLAKLTVVKATRSSTLGGSSVLQIADASAAGQAIGDRAEINFYTNSDSLPGNLQHATIGIIKTSPTGNETADLYFGTSTIGGSPVERVRITSAGPIIFQNNVCINGSGYGLQFTGGNNRIYFGACRAIEGSTSGTSLQLGEHYTKLSLQAHGQFSCGVGGGSPKLFFGEEGPESAGAKAIYLESYWMILQPHYNEGFRIRAVNASGTQRTLAEFYGSGEVYFASMAAAAGTYNVKWTSGGRITYDTSSCRYKNNIRNSVYGLCDILKLNSRMFEYKDGGRTDVGLIAEEVNQVIPELAIKNPEGKPDAVSYDRMVSVLIKGMQEQQCRIKLLESCLGIS